MVFKNINGRIIAHEHMIDLFPFFTIINTVLPYGSDFALGQVSTSMVTESKVEIFF